VSPVRCYGQCQRWSYYSEVEEGEVMPSVSERQRKFMGAELARKRKGKKTRTGMTEKQLREYAKKK